jgi:hypothetical protein
MSEMRGREIVVILPVIPDVDVNDDVSAHAGQLYVAKFREIAL